MKRLFLGALMVALVTAMIGCSAEPATPTFVYVLKAFGTKLGLN